MSLARGRIYSTVNSDGVSVFTDIEPEEMRAASSVSSSSSTQIVLPRGKVVNVNATAIRRTANPGSAAKESPPPLPPEGIPPEFQDGGPPPDDH
jgi:hypothetical protein